MVRRTLPKLEYKTLLPLFYETDSSSRSGKREAIVHIDDHANPTRHQQVENISDTIELFTRILTTPDSSDAENEIKCAFQLQSFFFESNGKIGQQILIL